MSNDPFIPEGLRKQQEYLDAQHRIQQPCWACDVPCNQFEAAHLNFDGEFRCPECRAPLQSSSPLVAVGPCYWYWSKPGNVRVTGWAEE